MREESQIKLLAAEYKSKGYLVSFEVPVNGDSSVRADLLAEKAGDHIVVELLNRKGRTEADIVARAESLASILSLKSGWRIEFRALERFPEFDDLSLVSNLPDFKREIRDWLRDRKHWDFPRSLRFPFDERKTFRGMIDWWFLARGARLLAAKNQTVDQSSRLVDLFEDLIGADVLEAHPDFEFSTVADAMTEVIEGEQLSYGAAEALFRYVQEVERAVSSISDGPVQRG